MSQIKIPSIKDDIFLPYKNIFKDYIFGTTKIYQPINKYFSAQTFVSVKQIKLNPSKHREASCC